MTTPTYVGDGNPDGEILGRSSGKVAFFGGTPATQPTAATSVTATQPTLGATAAYGFTTTAQFNALIAAVNGIISNMAALGLDA